MSETGSRVLLGVAAVLAGTTVLLSVFGFVYSPVLLLAAVPFGAATYFIWGSATGRLEARMRERVVTQRAGEGAGAYAGGGTTGPGERAGGRGSRGPGVGADRHERRAGDHAWGVGDSNRRRVETTESRSAAASVLGVDPSAGQAEIRRAFREKARELHPDAPGGDEAEFRRVRSAYERLSDGR